MTSELEQHNNNKSTQVQLRRDIILSLLESAELLNQEDIKSELHARGIQVSQTTVSRDLSEMGITKDENQFYSLSDVRTKQYHLKSIYQFFTDYDDDNTGIITNVKILYIQLGGERSQLITYHLKQAFPDIILHTIISDKHVIVYYDADEVTPDFKGFLDGEY